jgi:hypothetical protein
VPLRHLRRHQPHQDMRYLSHRWILSCHHVLPNEHWTRKPSQKPRIGVALHLQWPRRPTFAGLDTENSVEFLEEYEWYSTDAQVPPEKKMSEAIRCLHQTSARWAKFHQGKWQRFPGFCAEFLATYWSAGQQLAVRARVLGQRYNLAKGDSMVDFFMAQATQLRTLTQPFPECVMVENLMRLFPENILLLFKSENHAARGSSKGPWTSWSDSPCYTRQNANERSLPRENEQGRHHIEQDRHHKRPHEEWFRLPPSEKRKRFNPFSVPPPSHQPGNDDRA